MADIPSDLLLAIRAECQGAIVPVLREVREINDRLSKGDTTLALHDQRITAQEKRCVGTDRHTKNNTINPLVLAAVTGALSTVGSLIAVWFLIGIGQVAAKGTP